MSDSQRRGQLEDREWMSKRMKGLIALEVVFWAPRLLCWQRTSSRIWVSPKISLRAVCNSLTVSETYMLCSSDVISQVSTTFFKHWLAIKKDNTSLEGLLSAQASTLSHNVLRLAHSLFPRRIAMEKLDQALLTTRTKTRVWTQRSSKSQKIMF